MSQLSSLSFNSSTDSSLLVRDVAGSYRPAEPAEVLQAALRVLAGQLRGTEMLSSPQPTPEFIPSATTFAAMRDSIETRGATTRMTEPSQTTSWSSDA